MRFFFLRKKMISVECFFFFFHKKYINEYQLCIVSSFWAGIGVAYRCEGSFAFFIFIDSLQWIADQR